MACNFVLNTFYVDSVVDIHMYAIVDYARTTLYSTQPSAATGGH